MQMLKIAAIENGGHANQTYHGVLPDGWAVIPDGMALENFPFGEVTAEEIDGLMTVTGWTAGELPEPAEPTPPAAEPTVWDELDEAYREGVDSI